MNVIYIAQAGTDGPIRIAATKHAQLQRRIAAMQDGNPTILILAGLYTTENNLERRAHHHLAAHRIRDDWYQPAALHHLQQLPGIADQAIPFDRAAEHRRLEQHTAIQTLRNLARPAA